MSGICYVIVNYFSHQKIARLLASIPKRPGIHGIIVDNSADDEEFKALQLVVDRADVDCVQAERNGGFASGTNLGLRTAFEGADAFLILNPDTTVSENFFSALLDLHGAMPDVAISPHGIRMDSGEIWSAGGDFYWFRGRADVVKRSRRSGETAFGTCACLLVPKTALQDVGYLDEDFFLGGEEWDFSLRLRRAGWHIVYTNRAKYYHEVSGTHAKYGLRFFYVGMRTKVLFARKHYGALFLPWLIGCMLPSVPILLWRNSQLGHGSVYRLLPRMCVAVARSARGKKMTEREYISEGMTL